VDESVRMVYVMQGTESSFLFLVSLMKLSVTGDTMLNDWIVNNELERMWTIMA
jgi:hypothetical protein